MTGKVVFVLLLASLVAMVIAEAEHHIQKRQGDNSHWCCNILNNKGQVPARHRQIKVLMTVYEFKGNPPVMTSRQIYRTETVLEARPCPNGNLVCCRDYILIQDNCMHMDEALKNLDLLERLKKSGLLGRF
ncbi:unnamed protein product [Owenia fusiformis]|uniref:Uncharacterized protein n=1 Tax=Owenia fusiformis TaxID=6347 RepID=A0A8J1TZW9_OWEFU|nr:unnamed protein product [Owenia fusiformis]